MHAGHGLDYKTTKILSKKPKIESTNLFELNKRIKNIDLITNINVSEFNNEFVFLKIIFFLHIPLNQYYRIY